jgi:hypothetical protein
MNINKGDGIFEKLTDFLREKFPKHVKKETLILDRCEYLINKFYNKYLIYYNKYKNNKNDNTNKDLPETLNDLKNNYELTTEIQNEKSVVQRCVGTYQKKFNNKTTNKINQLTNITPDLEKYFEIRRDIAESINIYNKTNNMSISNSIRKVLSEQSEKTKSVLVEKEIIENKINYVFNSTNKINKKTVVIKESNNLLNMGYDKKLPADKVRLVENPKKFMEEYIESVLSKRAKDNEIVSKDEQTEEKEINPIVLKQLKSLKNTMNSHKLSINDIMKHLKDNE